MTQCVRLGTGIPREVPQKQHASAISISFVYRENHRPDASFFAGDRSSDGICAEEISSKTHVAFTNSEAGMNARQQYPDRDSPFNMFGGEKNSGIGR